MSDSNGFPTSGNGGPLPNGVPSQNRKAREELHMQSGLDDHVPGEREASGSQQGEALHNWLAHQLETARTNALTALEEGHGRLLERFQLELRDRWPSSPDLLEVLSSHAFSEQGAIRSVEPVHDCSQISLNFPDCHDVMEDLSTTEEIHVSAASRPETVAAAIHPDSTSEKTPRGPSPNAPSKTATSETLKDMMKTLDPRRTNSSIFSSVNEIATSMSPNVHLVSFEATVRGQLFECVFAGIILVNAVIMALQQQYHGLQIGYEVGYRTYERQAAEVWPGGEDAFVLMEKIFTIIFSLEIFARLAAYKVQFFKEAWSYVDIVIVTIAWLTWSAQDKVMMNPTFVRLARFGKLMRLVRLLRTNSLIDSLKLLVASIRASVNTLFWSLCVLLLIQSVAGLLLSQVLETFMTDPTVDLEIRREVFSYFGTFWRAMITIFEITFANWAPSCRLLMNKVDEVYGTFYLIYRCVIGFSVLLVIQAVFIQQTMKTAQLDDDFLAMQKAREKRKTGMRLHNLFNRLDESGDGYIDCNEFVPALRDGHLAGMLEIFDVEVHDLYSLFEMLVDEEGRISSEAFVRGITMMKGPAKATDLIAVLQILKRMEHKMTSLTAERSDKVARQISKRSVSETSSIRS